MIEASSRCTAASETLEQHVSAERDVGVVRRHVRELALKAGMGLVQKTKLVTATSELVRNLLEHGGGGVARARLVRSKLRGDRTGVEVVFEDNGPGIADVALAFSDGYSTGRGLGLGLGGSRRLVDNFAIETAVGRGTSIRICSWA